MCLSRGPIAEVRCTAPTCGFQKYADPLAPRHPDTFENRKYSTQVIGRCNMFTCSGNCIQERSAGSPMFSLITLLTLISLIVLQPRSYIKARYLVLSLVLHVCCFV